ncbi:MAG: RNA methyltransferase [Oscillospiraceae bacterium]|nr:RNA methyltransferase [Oscillospiraceae bacterium]
MNLVSSRDNPAVKEYIRISGSSAERQERGLCAVEGYRICMDAYENGLIPDLLFVTQEELDRRGEPLMEMAKAARRATVISPSVAQKLSDTKTPQGIFCLFPIPEELPEAHFRSGRYLLLEGVRDPGNIGTIVRTAEAFGIDGLILSSDTVDPYSPKVVRGTMGGIFRLPLRVVDNLVEELEELKDAGVVTYAAVCREGTPLSVLAKEGFPACCAVAIGNEGDGLQELTVAHCSDRITIDMPGRAESLNAAMAAGVLMWEMSK